MEQHTSETLQDETAVSKQLHCEVKTLQAWRCRGGGPPFVRVGRLVRYRPQDVEAWIESRRVSNTSDALRQPAHDHKSVGSVITVLLLALLLWAPVLPAWAAIVYVGGRSGSFGGTLSPTVIGLALTGGTDAAPQAGDFVIVSYGTSGTNDRALTIQNGSAVDYTLVGAEQFANDTNDTNLRVGYRVMPGSPETTVTLSQTFDVDEAGAYDIRVFRNVHATPLEQAAQQGTAVDTRIVNPGSITPTTAGTVVYVVGFASTSGTPSVFTSSDLTDFRSTVGTDVFDPVIGAGYFPWTAGAFSPATFGGGGTDSTNDSHAWTMVALAPAAVSATPCLLSTLGAGSC